MTALLLDPKLLNFLLVGVFALNALRWAIAGSWGDCAYWCGALLIVASIT